MRISHVQVAGGVALFAVAAYASSSLLLGAVATVAYAALLRLKNSLTQTPPPPPVAPLRVTVPGLPSSEDQTRCQTIQSLPLDQQRKELRNLTQLMAVQRVLFRQRGDVTFSSHPTTPIHALLLRNQSNWYRRQTDAPTQLQRIDNKADPHFTAFLHLLRTGLIGDQPIGDLLEMYSLALTYECKLATYLVGSRLFELLQLSSTAADFDLVWNNAAIDLREACLLASLVNQNVDWFPPTADKLLKSHLTFSPDSKELLLDTTSLQAEQITSLITTLPIQRLSVEKALGINQALSQSHSLIYLQIEEVTETDLIALATTLRTRSTLRLLDLRWTSSTENGAQALVQALTDNAKLKLILAGTTPPGHLDGVTTDMEDVPVQTPNVFLRPTTVRLENRDQLGLTLNSNRQFAELMWTNPWLYDAEHSFLFNG